MQEYCAPLMVGNCTGYCHEQCGPNELTCIDEDPYTGCVMGEWCHPAWMPSPHPEVICNVFCPASCPVDEYHCPETYDYWGCPEQPTCSINGECPESLYDWNGCPVIENVDCGQYGMPCYAGVDEKGCSLQDFCVHINTVCPTVCSDFYEEMLCPGPYDPYYDIHMPDECHPSVYYTSKNRICPGNCPTYCNNDEMWCPGLVDEMGCPGPDSCVPFGIECPSNGRDSDGCMMPTDDPNDPWNIMCAENEMPCGGDHDMYGCPLPPYCIESCETCPEPVFDDYGCDLQVYPECDWETEYPCHMGHDMLTGCDLGDMCVPKPMGYCQEVCPQNCEQMGMQECGMQFNDYGCQMQSFCVPMNEPCPMGMD